MQNGRVWLLADIFIYPTSTPLRMQQCCDKIFIIGKGKSKVNKNLPFLVYYGDFIFVQLFFTTILVNVLRLLLTTTTAAAAAAAGGLDLYRRHSSTASPSS